MLAELSTHSTFHISTQTLSINFNTVSDDKKRLRNGNAKPQVDLKVSQSIADPEDDSADSSDDEVPEHVQTARDARNLLRALGCKPVQSF